MHGESVESYTMWECMCDNTMTFLIYLQSTLGLWSTLCFHHFDRNSEFDHKEEEKGYRGEHSVVSSLTIMREFDHILV